MQPFENIVTDEPVLPLQNIVADALPNALVDQAITWPYHLPSFNGVDCLWWAMLVRSMYTANDTWLKRVAGWAQPIVRTRFVGTSNPAVQGHGLVELQDCALIVIPGTSSEREMLTYFLTHSLRILTQTPAGWKINTTWASRGHQVRNSWVAWPPPDPFKPVIVVGHSSGAAYGAYVAYLLYQDSQHPWTLATFGAPIWGTDSLAQLYLDNNRAPQTIDFAQPNDFVPTIPPPWAAIDLAMPLAYSLLDRPNYRRVNSLLLLQGTSAPAPSTQPSTLNAIVNAVLTLIRGGGFDVQHATSSYTAAADAWAANDPSLNALQLRPAYDSLKAILRDMDAAGVP